MQILVREHLLVIAAAIQRDVDGEPKGAHYLLLVASLVEIRRGRSTIVQSFIRRFFMTPTITAFEQSPDRGQGLARDMRVRWALEEVGQPYQVRLLSFAAMKEPAHLALHPFGQIPTYQDGDLTLFETGAIVFHIAERHAGLLPLDANARARAIMWMFAALNTVELPILDFAYGKFTEGRKSWYEDRLPMVKDRIRARLAQLSTRLGDSEWLDGGFSVGDLIMVSVLLRMKPSGMLNEFPSLAAYVARGEARPAYQRAFAAQLAVFTAASAGTQRHQPLHFSTQPSDRHS
jgi:glutathione S-transferase